MADSPSHDERTPVRVPHARPSVIPPPSAEQLRAAVRRACSRYYAGQRTPDADLRTTVCATVDALRLSGLPITAILPTVRTLIAHGTSTPQCLVDDAVRWCIARYFAGGRDGPADESAHEPADVPEGGAQPPSDR